MRGKYFGYLVVHCFHLVEICAQCKSKKKEKKVEKFQIFYLNHRHYHRRASETNKSRKLQNNHKHITITIIGNKFSNQKSANNHFNSRNIRARAKKRAQLLFYFYVSVSFQFTFSAEYFFVRFPFYFLQAKRKGNFLFIYFAKQFKNFWFLSSNVRYLFLSYSSKKNCYASCVLLP